MPDVVLAAVEVPVTNFVMPVPEGEAWVNAVYEALDTPAVRTALVTWYMFSRMLHVPPVVNLAAKRSSNGCPSNTEPAMSGDGVMYAATG